MGTSVEACSRSPATRTRRRWDESLEHTVARCARTLRLPLVIVCAPRAGARASRASVACDTAQGMHIVQGLQSVYRPHLFSLRGSVW